MTDLERQQLLELLSAMSSDIDDLVEDHEWGPLSHRAKLEALQEAWSYKHPPKP